MGCGSSTNKRKPSASVRLSTPSSSVRAAESRRQTQGEVKRKSTESGNQLDQENVKLVESKKQIELKQNQIDEKKMIVSIVNTSAEKDPTPSTVTIIDRVVEKKTNVPLFWSTNIIAGSRFENTDRWERVKRNRIIRIFLSSTFSDMQRERQTFTQYGEPRLREWANKKGLVLDFVDLRCEHMDEISYNSEVITCCYESIEQCPYFLCILGSRYGLIPGHSKLNEWHPEIDKRYPFLKEWRNLSVAHYQIKYGALKQNAIARRALFYERDETFVLANTPDLTTDEKNHYQPLDENDRMNQDSMKREIGQQFDIKRYQSAEELTKMMVDDLLAVFEMDFQEIKQLILENENEVHKQFMEDKLNGFKGRKALVEKIIDNVKLQLETEASQIAVIGAESGVGKSSVMATLVQEFQKEPGVILIYHFVGCSNASRFIENMNRRIYGLLFECQTIIDHPDSEKGKKIIKMGLGEILKQASTKTSVRIVVILDAINQLTDSLEYPHVHQLNWLPKKLDQKIALVTSTIDTHPSCQVARESDLDILLLPRLSVDEAIQVAESFARKRSDQSLNESQKQFLGGLMENFGHPLYLNVIINKMLTLGLFESTDKGLEGLLRSDNLVELYDLAIARWERRFNTTRLPSQPSMEFDVVGIVNSVLQISRIGLDDSELYDYITHRLGRKLTGDEILSWRSFFFNLLDSLVIRNGRYIFSHKVLEQAVHNRYFWKPQALLIEKRIYGLWLLDRWDSKDPDISVVAETCHSLCFGHEYAKLEQFLANDKVVVLLLGGCYKHEFYSAWRVLNKKGFDHKVTYENMTKVASDVGRKLVEYFHDVHERVFLTSIIQARISQCVIEDQKVYDYNLLAMVLVERGQYEQALDYLHRLSAIRTESLGDGHLDLATLYDNIATVYNSKGNYKQALQYHHKSLIIRIKSLGEEHLDLAISYDHIASVYNNHGKFDQALEYYLRSLKIRLQNLNHEHIEVAVSHDNIGEVYVAKRKYEQALDYYNKSLVTRIQLLGQEHTEVANSYNKIGIVHYCEGRHEKALDYLHKSLAIRIKLLGEEHPDVAESYNDIASFMNDQDRHEKALGYLHKSLAIRIKFLGEEHPYVAESYNNIASVYNNQGQFERAMEYFNKSLCIVLQSLGKDHLGVAALYNNMASVLNNVGKYEESLVFSQKSRIIVEETLGEGNLSMAASYHNTGVSFKNLERFQEAIDCFQKAKSISDAVHGTNHPETTDAEECIQDLIERTRL